MWRGEGEVIPPKYNEVVDLTIANIKRTADEIIQMIDCKIIDTARKGFSNYTAVISKEEYSIETVHLVQKIYQQAGYNTSILTSSNSFKLLIYWQNHVEDKKEEGE